NDANNIVRIIEWGEGDTKKNIKSAYLFRTFSNFQEASREIVNNSILLKKLSDGLILVPLCVGSCWRLHVFVKERNKIYELSTWDSRDQKSAINDGNQLLLVEDEGYKFIRKPQWMLTAFEEMQTN